MRTATPTFSIRPTGSSFQALATFPHGFASARRPIVGPAAGTPGQALADLLASADLLRTLTAMVDSPPAPDAD